MRGAALVAIGVYQRYVSPHKGFCCAYAAHTKRPSCSVLGARAIRRWGVVRGLAVLRLRLRRCGDVHRQCLQTRPVRTPGAQRGACDIDVLSGPDLDCCDCADGCDCGDCRRDRKPLRQDKSLRHRTAGKRWDESAGRDAGRRRD